jgi:peptidoglycan-associated lipoprotein
MPVIVKPSSPVVTPPPVDPTPGPALEAVVADMNTRLLDAYFDYDRAELRPDAVTALQHNAELLRPLLTRFPQVRVSIEGHCDERGSAAYNLALGDQRARRASGFAGELGLPPANVDVVSFGNEAPQCSEAVESCWQRNRRAHFRLRVP